MTERKDNSVFNSKLIMSIERLKLALKKLNQAKKMKAREALKKQTLDS